MCKQLSVEKTIIVHTQKPGLGAPMYVMAYNKHTGLYESRSYVTVRERWGEHYTAWYGPQVGEVETPPAYVVEQYNGRFAVRHNATKWRVADNIPTEEAAQRIADIYNEVAG